MEETKNGKGLLAWVRELLAGKEEELPDMDRLPGGEVVERLIGKATESGDTLPDGTAHKDTSADDAGGDPAADDGARAGKEPEAGDRDDGDREKSCCPYALKRNIVESLREVRRFAEEHNLAEAMVKALLTLLAEMALDALKGKVGIKALETLLKALTYQQHVDEAYLRGKNEKIEREYFPENGDIPHLGGMVGEEPVEPDIFAMASQA